MSDSFFHVCGNDLTSADYFGACLVELGVVIRYDFDAYPNVEAWLARMRMLNSWDAVHEVVYGFARSLEGPKFKAA